MDLKSIEKSRKLLIQVMGQETFDKFIENGKIEIKHGNIVYELDQDARVYNRTKNQSYCIEPICNDNLPTHDQLAIKYSYLKNKINKVEQVANKRSLRGYEQSPLQRRGHSNVSRFAGTNDIEVAQEYIQTYHQRPGYSAYVEYFESLGWRRSQIVLDERSTSVVTINNLNSGSSGRVIDIRCPAGQKMSIMGIEQVPAGIDIRTAHSLRARISDTEDNEIPFKTKLEIRKMKPSSEFVLLDSPFYSQLSLFKTNGIQELSLKTDNELYKFRRGIEVNGEEHLEIYVFNCERNICAENTRFALECDMWCR